MADKRVKIIQNKDAPIAAEIIASSIVEIGEGMRRLNSSRLNRRAIVTLIKDYSGLPKTEIERVLTALDSLETTYLKQR